ncbi:putative C-S lyase [Campylobacter sp. Cr9]|uniref:MalY/PatB family protein n=1 Tax=Campylobacter sp. Cr9 TaxID=2735728 RepID=UPI003014C039|nr:putative C-S lyase [Campylobacter sp. Cr9]
MQDFIQEHFINRKNTNSSKWDNLAVRFNDNRDLLAMWVADMEFKTAKEILSAINERVNHGIFGYSLTPNSYYESFISWMKQYHNVELKKEWIRFNLGVVNSIYHLINCFSKENDSILILSPVYYPFARAVKDNHRKLVENELVYNEDNGEFCIDYDKLEKDIITNDVKMVIFCSPHNPISRIWNADELKKCFDIFKKHNVLIISDEIHQDFTYKKSFISALNYEEYFDNLIILNAASKTFNLACLLNSHIIIPNEKLLAVYDEFAKRFNQIETNIIGQLATEIAYKKARYWLENVKEIIYKNYLYIKDEFAKDEITKNIIISPFEGTYLLFLNFSKVINENRMKEFIQDDCMIAIDYGDWFGKDYKGFMRVNLATAPIHIEEFVKRVKNQLKIKDYR